MPGKISIYERKSMDEKQFKLRISIGSIILGNSRGRCYSDGTMGYYKAGLNRGRKGF